MKVPNINCKYYTTYGKCTQRKGWFLYKLCVLLYDSSTCHIQKQYIKPPIVAPASVVRAIQALLDEAIKRNKK